MQPRVRILGVSGSGRRGSYNSALLRASKEVLPDNATMEIYDVSRFPLFNEDAEEAPPDEVKEFKARVRDADAILFASPEFNRSVSATLKNALEWGSRPPDDSVWTGKPAAIVSASTGPRGGARAQMALRQIMVDLNVFPINGPELFLAGAAGAFDAELRLRDEKTRERLREVLKALVDWALLLRGRGST